MGWNNGTPIFDRVCEVVFEMDIPKNDKYKIIHALADALMDEDWDTPEESEYWSWPLVRKVMKKLMPDADWEWIEDV